MKDDDLFEDGEKYLTVEEVAARWRISKMTVYRMIEAGELPANMFCRQKRIRHTAVVEYEQNSVYVPSTVEEGATG